MRRIIISMMFLSVLFIAAGSAAAQKPIRLQFAKGKSSATVKASTGKFGITYVIRAKAGQMLLIDVGPETKVGIRVETIGRYGEMVLLREARGGHYEVGLEESGDYTIFIGSTGRTPASFELTVGLRKMTDI